MHREKARKTTTFAFALPLVSALALGLVTQTGCSKRRDAGPEPSQSASTAASAAATPMASPLTEERAMRISVDMTVVVAHRDSATDRLRSTLSDFGGYVSHGRVTGSDETGSASFELKVPASKVEAFRASVRSLGEIREDTEKAEDVTEARADVRARVANARAEEARLVALLGDRTGNLGDVLAVEKELARVRETIERFEAEERVLVGQIAMATVKVEIATSYVYVEPGAGQRLASAAKDGVENAWGFVVSLGVCVLAAGPTFLSVMLMCAALFLGGRSVRRRLQRARLVASFSEPRM